MRCARHLACLSSPVPRLLVWLDLQTIQELVKATEQIHDGHSRYSANLGAAGVQCVRIADGVVRATTPSSTTLHQQTEVRAFMKVEVNEFL